MYKLSVIIPVYNVENYLRECLDSIINQTVKDIEIICVDDGSTDSSPDILKESLESRKHRENTLHLSTQTILLKQKCLKSSTQKQMTIT